MSRRPLFADTAPLRCAPFRRLWVSSVLTSVFGAFTAVCAPLQVYDISGSSAYVGLMALAGLGPMLAGALWGGAVADAADRRTMLITTNTVLVATSALLCGQAAVRADSLPLVFALVALQDGCYGANLAARGSTTPRLVPAELLTAANSLEAGAAWFGWVAGPLLAGALLPATGLAPLYLADSLALSAALWALWRLPPLPPGPAGASGRAGLAEIRAGLLYLARREILLAAFLADFIALLCGMPAALYPQLATQALGGPRGGGLALGVLNAAIPAGAVLAGAVSGLFTRASRPGAAMVSAGCVWGLAMAAVGLTGQLWQAALWLTVGGAALFMLSAFRKTIFQMAATDHMRGRMQGAMGVAGAGGPWLASLIHGTAGAVVGVRQAITAGGALAVVGLTLVAWRCPSLRQCRVPAPARRGPAPRTRLPAPAMAQGRRLGNDGDSE